MHTLVVTHNGQITLLFAHNIETISNNDGFPKISTVSGDVLECTEPTFDALLKSMGLTPPSSIVVPPPGTRIVGQ